MKVNTNVMALNAWRNLSATSSSLSKSLERLSSGLRINRAADDAAGLTISEKMRAQVKGLNQAVRNGQDAISLIQTAEGGLNEIHAILQRMRELSVQAANDTLTNEDRGKIQEEIDQLIAEINRIGNTTEFNTKKLLNGQAGFAASGANGSVGLTTDLTFSGGGNPAATTLTQAELDQAIKTVTPGVDTKAGVYTVVVQAAAAQATLGDVQLYVAPASAGTLTINGVNVSYSAGETLQNLILKINNVKNQTGVEATAGPNGGLQLVSTAYGSSATISVQGAAADLAAMGLQATGGTATNLSAAGTDARGTINGVAASGKGNALTLTAAGNDAVGMRVDIFDGTVVTGAGLTFSAVVDASGQLSFHIGANEGQNLGLSIKDMRADALSVSALRVDTKELADVAITTLDGAISTVSSERSKLGAVQNRLEHTITNLSVASENLTAAESRIRDADMAQEMMQFVRNQILLQSGTAMLAQANAVPQSVLQLLA